MENKVFKKNFYEGENMTKEIPNSLLWIFESYDLKNKRYLKDLEFIKNNTAVNRIGISVRNGVQLYNIQQCHEVMSELVEHAHKLGIKVDLQFNNADGWYNTPVLPDNAAVLDQVQLFPIPDPKKAAALVNDIELTTDENGFAEFTHTAKWARPKIMPIYSEILKAYSFEKTGEGFYDADTLTEITDKVLITNSRPNELTCEIDLGKENKNKNIFVLVAQYYNYSSMAEAWDTFHDIISAYADIPLDGIIFDEFGYMLLDLRYISKFRGRMYSKGMKRYYEDKLNIDLDKLLFDMRYAPKGNEEVRIKAINIYFETLRVFPLEIEKKAYAYAKELFGKDAYIACHNTFHNNLASDEIWRTGCNWWDIPRDFGHTDEDICFAVRWGVMLACKNPIMFDMFYSKDSKKHYKHIIEGAPFNCREFHHAFNDFCWGQSFTDTEFLKNIRYLDETVATLNDFQTVYPKMDLLIIYGAAAQNNWYPDYEARNFWDIDGTLKIQNKCEEMWNAGYRCALVPDYAIEDGRITRKGDKIYFNGYEFTHCLFLYPKYAKKETYEFINTADKNGVKIAVAGKGGVDFYGNKVELTAPSFDDFNLEILEKISCNKSAIDGGCVYTDGSFSLVSDSLLTHIPTDFDFELNGKRICGKHTGLLAFREGKSAFATSGSELFVDEEKIDLAYIK